MFKISTESLLLRLTAAVDTAAYELVGKQPVLYLPPPPEHPPPSDIGSPPDSPQTDPRYPPVRRLLHSDCEPSSPAQRRTGETDVWLLLLLLADRNDGGAYATLFRSSVIRL